MTKMTFLRPLLVAAALAAPLIALDARAGVGDIYETNEGNLLRIKPTGGTPGTFVTGFTNPKGLTFDGNGRLFVADGGKNAVIVFTVPDGTGTTYLPNLNSPTGVAFDASGNLYVAEAGSGNILKVAPDKTSTIFAANVGASAGLTFDSHGNLFAADFNGGRINKFAPDGTGGTFATGLNHPAGLAFDSAGNLYEADSDSGTIFKFAPDGTKTTFVTAAGRPFGIAFDATGRLVVADNENGATVRYDADGTNKANLFQSDFNTPQFVAIEPVQHHLLNISTRGTVQGGNDVLIAGFTIGGNGPVGTAILIRALGPSLSSFGITSPLADPVIELRDSSGTLLASNNNWKDSQQGAIQATGLAPSDDHESAILTTLNGGAFTAIVGSANGEPGTAVIEVYNILP